MRFGIGMNSDHTLEEVGQQFSVTRERIRQIEAKGYGSYSTRAAEGKFSGPSSIIEMAEQGPVKIQHFQTGSRPIYCSSVSGPVPGLGSRSDEMGVAVRIVSYSVTTTTPGTGSSITSMIVSSTGTTTCLGAFLGAFLPRSSMAAFSWPWVSGHPDRTPDLGLCLFRRRALCCLLARRLGAGLATFRAFLARRNALLCLLASMIRPCEYAAGKPISDQANYTDIISQRSATPPLSRIPG